MKISPIFYMGNKRKLIKKGLIKLFPSNINTFYDLFGGSGVVSMNVKSKNKTLNELDDNIFRLYITLKNTPTNQLIKHIEMRIDEFDLPRVSIRSTTENKALREPFKRNYIKFRNYYNKNRNPLDLFVLMNYCVSQTMRFNQKGEFNMPFGCDRFIKEKHTKNYQDFSKMLNLENMTLTNTSYLEFLINDYKHNDFIYLDPPYINTIATYNERGKWTESDDDELFNYCLKLSDFNIKFALSNVFKNKGVENTKLIEFVEKHSLNVHYFDDLAYSSFGRGNTKPVEVLITNY